MHRAVSNAGDVMDYLAQREMVTDLYYPGRHQNSNQAALFERYFDHGGAVITFRVDPSVNLVPRINDLHSTKMAPSFGSVDSLIEIPAFMSHWGKSRDELLLLGLDEHTVRLSVGIEPARFILDDLDKLTKC
jgi:cystathionine beta-lyase